MRAGGWNVSGVEFVKRLGDAASQLRRARIRQQLGRRRARGFGLEPHLELRNDADRLRDTNAILATRSECVLPKCALQLEGFSVQAFGANFTNQQQRMGTGHSWS